MNCRKHGGSVTISNDCFDCATSKANEAGREASRLFVGDHVIVKPLTKHMKDRTREHGERMAVICSIPACIEGVWYDVHLTSLSNTFKIGGAFFNWNGWVSLGRDCTLFKVPK